MNYYSTNHQSPAATLQEAVVRGLAPDKGLYMPERIEALPHEFFEHIDLMDFPTIACHVADAFFGEDVPQDTLHSLVRNALNFDVPLVPVADGLYSLELFHGPTLAFKDSCPWLTDFIPWNFSTAPRWPSRMWAPASWPVCWATSSVARAIRRSMCW